MGEQKMRSAASKSLGQSIDQDVVTNEMYWCFQTEGLATVVQVSDLRHLNKLEQGAAYLRTGLVGGSREWVRAPEPQPNSVFRVCFQTSEDSRM